MAAQPSINNAVDLQARVANELVARLRIAYAQISPELTIVDASPDFCLLLQETAQPLEGAAVGDVVVELWGTELNLKKILSGELRAFRLPRVHRTHPDGTSGYYDFSISALDAQQPGQGLLLIVEDVTCEGMLEQTMAQDRNELRLAQEDLAQANETLERLNRLKSLFLSMAVHDLRTPLAAIQGYVELGIESLELGDGGELRDFLPAIQTQIDRLQHLIGDFLDMDAIERGKLSIYPMPCMLAEAAQEAAATLQEYINRQKLRLILELQDEVQVMADPSRLRQALYNLLSNAIKYGGGEIRLRTWSDQEYGYLQVQDSGLGIAAEHLPHLFELYSQVDEAQHSQGRGSGLGLFIVKSLIEAQHGRIEVRSATGQGTVFKVCLPLAR